MVEGVTGVIKRAARTDRRLVRLHKVTGGKEGKKP